MSFILSNLILLCGLVINLLFYRRLQPVWLRYFSWFLLFTLFVQLTGYYYSVITHKSNHFIFNTFIFIQFLFYFFLFFKVFTKKWLRYFVVLAAVVFAGYDILSFLFGHSFLIFNQTSNSLGSILIIVCSLLYFRVLFLSDTVVNYFRLPMFWIATGLLFYFTGNFAYLSLVGYIVQHNLDKGGYFYAYAMTALNFILYGLFITGFLSNQLWNRET